MIQTLEVRLLDENGQSMPEYRLRSLYGSDLHFEPVRRRSEIRTDGTVALELPTGPRALHARIAVPDFGDIWVSADNSGEGYTAGEGPLDFTLQAATSRLKDVEDLMRTGEFTAECVAHADACRDFLGAAMKHPGRAARYRLQALSHGLWAGELAVVEKARATAAERGKRKGFLFGCNTFRYKEDTPCADAFKGTLNFGTLPFYLKNLEPEEGKPDYTRVDTILDWCEQSGIRPKGHPLWWGHEAGIPPWLEGATWHEAKRHCARVVGRSVERYRGRINVWDVINEAHDWANGLHLTHEQEVEITRLCCDTARAKNPDATLIVNNCCPFGEYAADGTVHKGPIYDEVFTPLAYLDALMQAGVDFDVVGVQIYFPARDMLAVNKLLDEYARFGKPVHITELGVRSVPEEPVPGKQAEQVFRTRGHWHQPWCEKVQADWMEWFYTVAYARPEIEAITWWDFADPAFIPTSAFLSEDNTPREMYYRLRALRSKLERG